MESTTKPIFFFLLAWAAELNLTDFIFKIVFSFELFGPANKINYIKIFCERPQNVMD